MDNRLQQYRSVVFKWPGGGTDMIAQVAAQNGAGLGLAVNSLLTMKTLVAVLFQAVLFVVLIGTRRSQRSVGGTQLGGVEGARVALEITAIAPLTFVFLFGVIALIFAGLYHWRRKRHKVM